MLIASEKVSIACIFVACHYESTLTDLVPYGEKHDEANGERNRGKSPDNFRGSCAAESATKRESVLRLREMQIRDFAPLLMVCAKTIAECRQKIAQCGTLAKTFKAQRRQSSTQP